MKEPKWITHAVIIAVQEELLSRFGGLPGIRDDGLLDSALNRAIHLHQYGEPTLFELAAAYVYRIVKNHPFLDGNKRAGFMAAYIFLGANGYQLQPTDHEAVVMTVALAAGEIEAGAYALWLKDNCVKG